LVPRIPIALRRGGCSELNQVTSFSAFTPMARVITGEP
jgi:hypothetical protein